MLVKNLIGKGKFLRFPGFNGSITLLLVKELDVVEGFECTLEDLPYAIDEKDLYECECKELDLYENGIRIVVEVA